MKSKVLKPKTQTRVMISTLLLTLVLCPIFQMPVINWEDTFLEASAEHISRVRMPIEGWLSILNPVVAVLNTRPIQFGLLVGHDYSVQFSAEKLRDVDGKMSMKMSVPTSLTHVAGNLAWEGNEREGMIEARIRAEKQGDFLINATASNLANGFTITLEILARARLTSDQLDAFESLNAARAPEEAGPVYTITDANRSGPSINAPANYAHIYGIVYTYPYSNGRSYMLRGIQVELWEDVPLWFDTHIKTVFAVEPTIDDDYGLTPRNYVSGGVWYHVDDSGKFDFGNVYVGSGKTLYVKVFFIFHDEGDGISLGGTEKLGITDAAWSTISVRFNIGYYSSGQDSGILGLTFAQLNAGNSLLQDEATHVFYDIVKAYGYFESLVGFEPGLVTSRIDYSSTSNPGCAGSTIYFNGWTIDYLVYETTDIILHEYSHSVHWYMRGGSFPPLAPGDTNHGGHNNSDSSDALTEGWADFVPTVINKDPIFHWASTTGTWDIRPNYTCPVCGVCDRDEWVFASILWDIRGDLPWATSHSGFFPIASTLDAHDPNLVRTFFDNFISDWDQRQPMWQVFYNHGVNYDTTSPSNPSLWSPSHSTGVWSSDNTTEVQWSGASDDLSGVYGYSREWDTNPLTIPDTTVDQTTTYCISFPLSTGNSWYFHIRTRDNAGNWNPGARHIGPFYIDTTLPNTPSISADPSHCPPDTWTTHNSPYFTWSNPGDSGSGVSSYEGSVNDGAPFPVSDPYHPTWGDGIYTFKVRAVDGVGLRSGWSNVITVKIQQGPTTVHSTITSTIWTTITSIFTTWQTYTSTVYSTVYQTLTTTVTGTSTVWSTQYTTVATTSVTTHRFYSTTTSTTTVYSPTTVTVRTPTVTTISTIPPTTPTITVTSILYSPTITVTSTTVVGGSTTTRTVSGGVGEISTGGVPAPAFTREAHAKNFQASVNNESLQINPADVTITVYSTVWTTATVYTPITSTIWSTVYTTSTVAQTVYRTATTPVTAYGTTTITSTSTVYSPSSVTIPVTTVTTLNMGTTFTSTVPTTTTVYLRQTPTTTIFITTSTTLPTTTTVVSTSTAPIVTVTVIQLTVCTPYDDSIISPGQEKRYVFSASAGTHYVIETSNLGGGMDTYIYLYDRDGVTEIAHDDDSGGGLASRIEWTCPISGDYYVKVRHYWSGGTGTYTIHISSVEVQTLTLTSTLSRWTTTSYVTATNTFTTYTIVTGSTISYTSTQCAWTTVSYITPYSTFTTTTVTTQSCPPTTLTTVTATSTLTSTSYSTTIGTVISTIYSPTVTLYTTMASGTATTTRATTSTTTTTVTVARGAANPAQVPSNSTWWLNLSLPWGVVWVGFRSMPMLDRFKKQLRRRTP